MTHGPEAKMETRAVAGASSLTRDRESNVLAASGREAAALLECVRAIARFPPEQAAPWWRGEVHPDGAIAAIPLELLRWALEGAYAEYLGDFARWMFTAPPRACIAGEGDREAAVSLEEPLARFASDVAAKTLPWATEAARRGSLIAQVDAFALLSEPMLIEKRDALVAFGCPTLAGWAEAARALAAYFASPERAAIAAPSLGSPTVTHGLLSLDFPSAASPPAGVELHRWWAFCESQFVIAQHEGLPDEPGFLFARSGPLGGKLFFRIENGTRQVLCGTQAR